VYLLLAGGAAVAAGVCSSSGVGVVPDGAVVEVLPPPLRMQSYGWVPGTKESEGKMRRKGGQGGRKG